MNYFDEEFMEAMRALVTALEKQDARLLKIEIEEPPPEPRKQGSIWGADIWVRR